jgi:hypothetical protein
MGEIGQKLQFGHGALGALLDDIDDWCGTKPHPRPHGPWLRDVLVAVAISELVATVGQPAIREEIQRASSKLIEMSTKSMALTR